MREFLKTFKDIYYNIEDPSCFGGVYNAAKKKESSISIEDVKKWLESQDTYNLFRSVKRRFPRLMILVDRVDEQWQADLMEMTWFQSGNDRVKYLLNIIDVLSRYAWCIPLKNKSADCILQSFKEIFEIRKPGKLQTDQGKEFVNSKLKDFLKSNNVNFFTTTDDTTKCARVERFNRTLREKIYRYIYYSNSNRYLYVLEKIMQSYNSSYHQTLGMSPKEVKKSNTLQVIKNIRNSRKENLMFMKRLKPLPVGAFVRISKKKQTFEKGSTSNYSNEIFKIRKRKQTETGYVYKLEDLSGEKITSIFYPQEIITVSEPKVFKIENILTNSD